MTFEAQPTNTTEDGRSAEQQKVTVVSYASSCIRNLPPRLSSKGY